MPRFSVLLFLLALLTLQHVRVGANNRLLRKRNLYDVDMDEQLQERDLSQIWQEASQQLSDAQKKRLLGKKTSKSDGGNVSDYSSGKGKGSKKVSYSLNGKEGGKVSNSKEK